jgi:hypothetical protein
MRRETASWTATGFINSCGSPARRDSGTFEVRFLDPGVQAYVFTFG